MIGVATVFQGTNSYNQNIIGWLKSVLWTLIFFAHETKIMAWIKKIEDASRKTLFIVATIVMVVLVVTSCLRFFLVKEFWTEPRAEGPQRLANCKNCSGIYWKNSFVFHFLTIDLVLYFLSYAFLLKCNEVWHNRKWVRKFCLNQNSRRQVLDSQIGSLGFCFGYLRRSQESRFGHLGALVLRH
jgi:hypothetical protein